MNYEYTVQNGTISDIQTTDYNIYNCYRRYTGKTWLTYNNEQMFRRGKCALGDAGEQLAEQVRPPAVVLEAVDDVLTRRIVGRVVQEL